MSIPLSPSTPTIAELLNWTASHPLPDGRLVPLMLWSERAEPLTQLRAYADETQRELRIIDAPLLLDAPSVLAYLNEHHATTGDRLLVVRDFNRARRAPMNALVNALARDGLGDYQCPKAAQVIALSTSGVIGEDTTVLEDFALASFWHVACSWNPQDWLAEHEHPHVATLVDALEAQPNKQEAVLPLEVSERLRIGPRNLAAFAALSEDEMPSSLHQLLVLGLLGQQAQHRLLAA